MKRIVMLMLVIAFVSCNGGPQMIPKPRSYPKVVYPEKDYIKFDSDKCPFVFEYPSYSKVSFEKSFFNQKPLNPCWFDLDFFDFNGKIHFSYFPIDEENNLDKLITDAFRIADNINKRSSFQEDLRTVNPNGVGGLIMHFEGPAASPMHFFLTDSTTHFLKGSLYFNAEVVLDSIEPIAEFLKQDVAHIIHTANWKD